MAHGAISGTRRQVLAVIALATAVAAFLSVTVVGHKFFDLEIYYGAVRYWALDGGDIYDWIKRDTRYGFTYPPFAALVMLPWALLPWPLVLLVSLTATIAATGLVLWWLVDPISRRMGWDRWFAFAVACCLVAALEPVRETVDFGQVNMLLLAVVATDLLWLVGRGSRWAGVGIGLATTIKLTPGIFILYLLVTGRWRAAATAAGTAFAATVFAAAVAPAASRRFWTEALWNTDRIGELEFISNQSLQGVVARLNPADPSVPSWAALVIVVLTIWVRRTRAAVAGGDEAAGLALTGVVMCLISPVTWVHHLVWLVPALVLVVDDALRAGADRRRRRVLLGFAAATYALLTSRLVWLWEYGSGGLAGFLGANAYVWASLALLLVLPARRHEAVAEPGQPSSSPGQLSSARVPRSTCLRRVGWRSR